MFARMNHSVEILRVISYHYIWTDVASLTFSRAIGK